MRCMILKLFGMWISVGLIWFGCSFDVVLMMLVGSVFGDLKLRLLFFFVLFVLELFFVSCLKLVFDFVCCSSVFVFFCVVLMLVCGVLVGVLMKMCWKCRFCCCDVFGLCWFVM